MKAWADRLKQAVRTLMGRDHGAPSPGELRHILARWQIDRYTVRKRLPGSSAAAWLIETPQGTYVLRRAGDNRRYIEFQAFVMNALTGPGFCCQVPRLLDADGQPWHVHQGYYWVVYPFIPGETVGLTLSVDQARQLGTVVARFHELSATWDIEQFHGGFTLSLFEAQTSQALTRSLSMPAVSAPRRLLAQHQDAIRLAYDTILASDLSALSQLQQIAIHYDWQGCNLLSHGADLSAVLDFDSLVEAPRLIDLLNALFYSATTNSGVDRSRLETFVHGYVAVSPLLPAELALAYPCAFDRLLWLILSIFAEQDAPRRSHNQG